jgi:hypothetical protein
MAEAKQAGPHPSGATSKKIRPPTHRPADLRSFPEGHYRNFWAWAFPLKLLNRTGSGVMFSIGRGLRYSIGGCSVLLAIVSVVIGIEVSVATASSGTAPSVEIMNRARKGDRLPLVPALHRNAVNRPLEVKVLRIPAHDPGLAEGCESLASPLAHSEFAHSAGRCLS